LFSAEDLRNKLQEKDSAIKDLENAITLLKQEHATEHDRLASEVQSLQRQLTEKNTAVSEFETQLRGVHEALQSVEELVKGLELERTELHARRGEFAARSERQVSAHHRAQSGRGATV
jgi:chromosome segregation ATPase